MTKQKEAEFREKERASTGSGIGVVRANAAIGAPPLRIFSTHSVKKQAFTLGLAHQT